MYNQDYASHSLPRIKWLDVLRGLAIILVVLYHFTNRYTGKYGHNAFADAVFYRFDFGWIGVHLFFMISGFIIYLSIQNKKGPLDFLISRLSRLLPPYWISIIVILALAPLHEKVFNIPERFDIPTILANLGLYAEALQLPFLEGAFWTLYVELRFYLFFAVLWKFVDLKKKSTYYMSYILLLAAAGIPNYVNDVPLSGGDLNYFLLFWLGIAACKVLMENMAIWEYALISFTTAASTFWFHKENLNLFFGVLIFSALFIFCERAFKKHGFLERIFSPLAFTGRISYSGYLLHDPIGFLLLGVFSGMALSYNLSLAIALSVSFTAAWLSFLFIERQDKKIAACIKSYLP
ncbi:MAG: acyltransferase [Deltaproteobacteria bacterium]|nr:acyltransferase [Deltaproteobacteria bacterium]